MLLRNNLRQVVHTLLPLSPSSIIWYQRKLGSKQAYRVVHQPVSRGFAVFADAWLSGWLAEISADLRENGSALEVVLHDYALYKSTFTLLYFTDNTPARGSVRVMTRNPRRWSARVRTPSRGRGLSQGSCL